MTLYVARLMRCPDGFVILFAARSVLKTGGAKRGDRHWMGKLQGGHLKQQAGHYELFYTEIMVFVPK